jgi:hypothetical protein
MLVARYRKFVTLTPLAVSNWPVVPLARPYGLIIVIPGCEVSATQHVYLNRQAIDSPFLDLRHG